MKTKICKICGIEKPLSEFHKDKNIKDGHTNYCKECRSKQNKKYKKSLKGFLKGIYNHQKETSKRRRHHFPLYSFETLCKWFVLQPNWEDLWLKYQASNYDRNLAPSVDRLNDNKGYSLDNIQLITAYENAMKQINKSKKLVNCYTLKGKYIITYESITEASKVLHIGGTNIISTCLGKYRYAGNYQWRFLSDEFPKNKDILPMREKVYEGIKILCKFENNETKNFNSIDECAKYFNCSITPIRSKLQGKQVKTKQLQKIELTLA